MKLCALVCVATLFSAGAAADPSDFAPGPVIAGYGAVAPVDGAEPLPGNVQFKVAFDVSEAAETGEVNRRLESAARFLNMHATAGVEEANITLAIVVHGAAARDLTRHPQPDAENASAGLIAALIEHNVRIYLCGQTAAHYGIEADDLLPGVRLSLSAMTAHALLQQEGYTLNPF